MKKPTPKPTRSKENSHTSREKIENWEKDFDFQFQYDEEDGNFDLFFPSETKPKKIKSFIKSLINEAKEKAFDLGFQVKKPDAPNEHTIYEKAYQDAAKRFRMREEELRGIVLDEIIERVSPLKHNLNTDFVSKHKGTERVSGRLEGYNIALADIKKLLELLKNSK